MLCLNNARLNVHILPGVGGGLARFDWCRRGEPIALMRPLQPSLLATGIAPDPNQLACYPLLPWSNRIAEGGFSVDGHHVALSPNRDDDPYPIHGSGWQRAWRVLLHSEHEALLVLEESEPGAYSYRASLRYALDGDTLRVELQVTHTGSRELPFGLGLHPFFLRHDEVELKAPAREVWLNDGISPLPVVCVDAPPAWDFSDARAMPDDLNHSFHAWTGVAMINWPRLGLGLQVETDADAFVLYTPADQDFFCFEPVDHAINAVHLPGGPLANGMTMLAPQASLVRRFAFRVVDPTQR